jgi:thymidylate synthase (FAD)
VKIHMIAQTTLDMQEAEWASGGVWKPEEATASDLAEFAGRACYQSWTRPNAKTATNHAYLAHIIDVKHESVLEHGTVTFYVEEVSRSLTHELVRHRHFSYSQLSQRFVTVKATPHTDEPEDNLDTPYVVPPLFEGDARANAVLSAAWDYAVHAYENLIEAGNRIIGDGVMVRDTSSSKRVREAARAVLPNMTPTAIVVTGNHRAWREFLVKRGSLGADAEIRRMAVAVYRMLNREFPALYQDFASFNTGETEWVDQYEDWQP